MRLGHFADLHLDRPFRWAGSQNARILRDRLRETLKRIIDVAIEEDLDVLMSAGDLFEHDLLTPDTEAFLVRQFSRLDETPVLLAPGNHDYFSPNSAYARLDWSPNVHVFTEDALTPYELTGDLTIWGAAHRVPANTPNLLEGEHLDCPGINLGLFHGAERNWYSQEEGKQPHAPFDSTDIAEAGLAHVFCGHIHTPKHTSDLTYPGNPHPLSFGETGQRGLVIADVDESGVVHIETRQVASTESHDIAIDVTGAQSRTDVQDMVEESLARVSGVARVTLSGELPPHVDLRLADLESPGGDLLAVSFRTEAVSVAFDLDAIAQEETVRGEFVREVLASDMNQGDRNAILAIGLRALEGRSNLGAIA